jgi:hypothetical protein
VPAPSSTSKLHEEKVFQAVPEFASTVDATANADTVAASRLAKDHGNKLFAQKKFADAATQYGVCLDLDPWCTAALANRAAAYLRLAAYKEAVADCTLALQQLVEDTSVASMKLRRKLLFRKAQGLSALGNREKLFEAEKLLEDLSHAESNDTVATELSRVKKLLAAAVPVAPAGKSKPAEDVPQKGEMVDTSKEDHLSSEVVPPVNPSTAARLAAEERAREVGARATEVALKRASLKKRPVPKTSYEFERVRRELRLDGATFATYLSAIPPKQIPKLFRQSLTEETLSAMVEAITCYIVEDKPAVALVLLAALTKVNRFNTTLLFLEKEQMEQVSTIFKLLRGNSDVSQKKVVATQKLWAQ